MKESKGFTLIELVIIILIVAVLAFTLGPRLKKTADFRLPLVTEKVARDLRYARQKGMDTRVVYGIEFTPPAAYWVFRSVSTTVAEDPLTRQGYTVALDSGEFGGVTISSANFAGFASVQFDPSGSPSAGGSVVLTAGGSTRTVSVEAGTGKVSY